jgi:coenzyme F420-reducing hydrogenase delta subunit
MKQVESWLWTQRALVLRITDAVNVDGNVVALEYTQGTDDTVVIIRCNIGECSSGHNRQ